MHDRARTDTGFAGLWEGGRLRTPPMGASAAACSRSRSSRTRRRSPSPQAGQLPVDPRSGPSTASAPEVDHVAAVLALTAGVQAGAVVATPVRARGPPHQAPADQPPERLFDQGLASGLLQAVGEPVGQQPRRSLRCHAQTRQLRELRLRCRRHLVLLPAGQPLPQHRGSSTALVEELVSHGYVDHTDDAGQVEFPGGRVEKYAMPPLTGEDDDPTILKAVDVRVADTRFVLINEKTDLGTEPVSAEYLKRNLLYQASTSNASAATMYCTKHWPSAPTRCTSPSSSICPSPPRAAMRPSLRT